MKSRYYSFFAILRLANQNKQLFFSAPGNKTINKILCLLRSRGLIGGFSLDFGRKKLNQGYWHGYPKYKVFLKYSYIGYPVIKKFDCYKMTRTNFSKIKAKKKNYFSKIQNNNFYIVSSVSGIRIINNNEWTKLPMTAELIAKIKV